MSSKIDRRDDIDPKAGKEQYGDVDFADSTNKKYPIDTPEHVRAAWSYINHKDNAAKYDRDEVTTIKRPHQARRGQARRGDKGRLTSHRGSLVIIPPWLPE